MITTVATALDYVDAGWHPIPLPSRKKGPPPDGLTGYDGEYLTRLEVAALPWRGNIGLRMAPDMVGIDIDAYNGGLGTIAEVAIACGAALPKTRVSHSGRDDGSGIHFFRIPNGTHLVPNMPGVELIQSFHRYAAVWPSVHPEGRTYGWFDTEDEAPCTIPLVEDLPELGWAWTNYLRRSSSPDGTTEPAAPAVVEAFMAGAVEALAPFMLGELIGHTTEQLATGRSRHDTFTHAHAWAFEEAAAGLYPARRAVEALHALWVEAFADRAKRPESPGEHRHVVAWAVARALSDPDKVARIRLENEPLVIGATTWTPPLEPEPEPAIGLPETFWRRVGLATVRHAAQRVGVSPEALMFAVLAAVSLHVPPTVGLQGRRVGAPNLLVGIVGPPGDGKGTVLDAAMQLVPAPLGARFHPLGSAQGLISEFYEPDPDSKAKGAVRRAYHPVLIRCNEISSFAARTMRGQQGDDLISQLKSAVSNEQLGHGFRTAEKNLRVPPLSYRLSGVIGIAPSKASPLFDDLGGGLPERILFAWTHPDDHQGAADEAVFDAALEDGVVVDELAAGALRPLEWTPPLLEGRTRFGLTRNVAEWIETESMRRRGDPFDAHVGYLRHQLAACLAYLDGRWYVASDDFELAGELITVHRLALRQLLARVHSADDEIEAKARQRHAERQVAGVVSIDAYRQTQHEARVARQMERIRVQLQRKPTTRRDVMKMAVGATAEVLTEALQRLIDAGHVVETVTPTTVGGSPKKVLRWQGE